MNLNLPIFPELSLTISDKPMERSLYPTSRLQKGLLMNQDGQNLAEEAVGFGVPVLKQGLQAIFPGKMELAFLDDEPNWAVCATFTLNLVEKISRAGMGSANSKALYAVKNILAAFIRAFPLARGTLTALSNGARKIFRWETAYEEAGSSTQIKMIDSFDHKNSLLTIRADLTSIGAERVTEVIVMNEQGAHSFNQYSDSGGISLSGKEIGCWDEVTAESASFASSTRRLSFTLKRMPGTRLFRGRELVGSRLAWAGFGYSFPPDKKDFEYAVRFERIP
jgi:hypothetical protein